MLLPAYRVDRYGVWYLAPWGGTAREALVYLPGFNDAVRQRMVRKGFKLLSQAVGDFSERGENALRIGPPTDEAIQEVIDELRRRRPSTIEALKDEVEEANLILKDALADADEKKVYRRRLRQLKKLIAEAEADEPNEAELRAFFYREQAERAAISVPLSYRQAVAAAQQERFWRSQIEEAEAEVEQSS